MLATYRLVFPLLYIYVILLLSVSSWSEAAASVTTDRQLLHPGAASDQLLTDKSRITYTYM